MNTKRIIVAGLAVVGSTLAAATAHAQTGQPPRTGGVVQTSAAAQASQTAAAPGTRVGVLNIAKVLKDYNRFQQYNATINQEFEGFAKQVTAKKDEMAKLQIEASKAVDQAQRDTIEKRGLQLQREMQDIDAVARKEITAKQGMLTTAVFKEIEGVVQRVAVANGFDLVMSYPDPTTEAEKYTSQNVLRKIGAPAAFPLFVRPHIDITDAVVQTLNASYPAPPPAATAPAGSPAAPR